MPAPESSGSRWWSRRRSRPHSKEPLQKPTASFGSWRLVLTRQPRSAPPGKAPPACVICCGNRLAARAGLSAGRIALLRLRFTSGPGSRLEKPLLYRRFLWQAGSSLMTLACPSTREANGIDTMTGSAIQPATSPPWLASGSSRAIPFKQVWLVRSSPPAAPRAGLLSPGESPTLPKPCQRWMRRSPSRARDFKRIHALYPLPGERSHLPRSQARMGRAFPLSSSILPSTQGWAG